LKNNTSQSRINARKDKTTDVRGWIEPTERLSLEHELQRQVWKTLNRLRAGVGRSTDNMLKWRNTLMTRTRFVIVRNDTDDGTPIGTPDGTGRTLHARRPDSGQPESHGRGPLLDNSKYLVFNNFIVTSTARLTRETKKIR